MSLPTSRQQRLLSLLIVILFYAVSVAAYCSVFEDWPLVDALIFATSILTTVGFGQPWVPSTASSKIFTSVFILVTCAIGASGFGVLAMTVADNLSRREVALERRIARALCAGRCRRSGKVSDSGFGGGLGDGESSGEWAADEDGVELVAPPPADGRRGSERAAELAALSPASRARRVSTLEHIMVEEEQREARGGYWCDLATSLCRSLVFGAALIVAGAAIFMQVEAQTFRTFVDAAYFSVVTAATIGFGDLEPQTTPGKVVVSLYMLVASGIFAQIMTSSASLWMQHEHARRRLEVLDKPLSRDELVAAIRRRRPARPSLAAGGSDAEATSVLELEYTQHMLLSMHLVDARTLAAVAQRFRRLARADGSPAAAPLRAPPLGDTSAA